MPNCFMLVLVTCFLLLTQPYLLHAKMHRILTECKPKGYLPGKANSKCNKENQSDCCQADKLYPKYYCSPPVTSHTPAIMTLNSFEKPKRGKENDGGGKPACGDWHNDSELVVALSTGWYNNKSRCNKKIRIHGNGKSALATVVDECDSRAGCDHDHDYQPPCDNNVVDASKAVWKKLGYTGDKVGYAKITWSDA